MTMYVHGNICTLYHRGNERLREKLQNLELLSIWNVKFENPLPLTCIIFF